VAIQARSATHGCVTTATKVEVSTVSRIFQQAGCRSVISTLWNVDQRSSLAFFGRFYYLYFERRMAACDAIATVQREFIRRADEWNHPYHWSAYSLSGDWRSRNHERE
jgi:CHAT domain-containing protein